MVEALWDYYTYAELEGGIDIVGENDRDLARIAKENHERSQKMGRQMYPELN